jgi:outer membrane protein assembly factor BamB
MRRLAPVALLLALAVPAPADYWPAFRGADRAGVAEAKTLPATWDTAKNVAWKADVPGAGWSSPVVWGGRVFLTAAVSDAKQKEPRKGLYISDLRGNVPPGEHRRLVLCYDAATGKLLWQRTAFAGKATGTIHLKNSLASETPVSDGERVYAYFGNVGVACYDFAGKELWSVKTPAHKTRMGWGTAASPALHGDRLFLVHDNEEQSFLLALDTRTGKQAWRVERKGEGSNWGTPFVWKNELRTEVVTAGSQRVRSYGLDGKLLWELKGMSLISIPTPFARHGLLYVTSGYVADPFLKPVYAIRPGGSGDITPPDGQERGKYVAWCQPQAGPYHPTPLVYGDYLYVLYDRGFLACYEAKTGKEVYRRQRLGAGATAFTASPWAYGGKVFCLSEDGETFVVQAGPVFKVLARNKLGEMSLATPALAGGSLFLRTQGKLYCLRQPAKGPG